MDTIISKYFCIFCENCTNFESMSEAYNHYNNHMKYWYYCPDCDNQRKCNENHSNDAISEEERSLIEMWIERFLSYQSELIEKTYEDLFRATKLFSGCAVCETFLRLCTNNDIKYTKGDIHWSSNQSTANESRHVCSHLRYYPFECYHCEKVGKYHKKCDMSEITRHIRNSHSMSVRNPNFETMIKSVKIRKLENLIEFNFKNRNQKQPNTPVVVEKAQPSPPLSPPQPSASTPTPLSPIRSSRRLINQLSRPPQQPPVMSEPPTKRPKVGTQMIVINSNNNNNQNNVKTSPTKVNRNTMICNQKNDVILNIRKPNINSNSKTIIQNINNGGKGDQRMATQSKAKVEIKFKPIVKTLPNLVISNQIIRTKQNKLISGDQIIIKKVSDNSNVGPKPISLIHKSTAKVTTKPVIHTMKSLSLSQQFSDMMDDEEEELQFKLDSNRIIQNVSYFCIFCPQKISDKEEAYRHLQKHVDYYPIVCLLCGEGLTDCQSFMKHHRESHPEALKGKYKKKEQPIIDKWISSFLYSQATIIRSFPPRESCPVCDLLFTHSDIMKNKPRRCTVNRKIDHLYRHLSYLPYECILCRQTGQEFLVAYFESKAHSHIKLKHPEIDDNEERWQVFQKTISIPKLDEFIENYLSEFGISMQLERRPVKKANKYGTSPEPFATSSNTSSSATNKFDNSSLNLNMIFSDIMETPNETNKTHRIKPENEMIVDNKQESPLLNEFNNNSNDSNIIVSVSPLNLFDKSTSDDIEEEEDMYFCIFCPQTQYFTKMEAYSHYGSHLDYNPVLCKICSQSFADVDHLMTHHQSIHTTQDNVDYEIREDQVLVKWVNEFLESQKSIKKVMPCSCSYNCPVCLKLIGNELSDISMPCTHHNDVIFSVHIHKHLNYFPYECLTCKRNNRLVRVPNLDAMAMNHLKEHNIMNASMSQVVRSFPKTLVISQLEKLIGDSVHRKRVSEKKNRFDINTNRYDLDVLPQTKSNTSLKAITIPKSEPSTSRLSPIRTQHIRLEGGRVVNLPQRARLLADNGMTVLSIRGREVDTNGSNNQLINKIRCFHCRKYFPDKKLFKVHHNQSHPGKPILCSKSL